jgi:NAD(P)-dependent dehydrogenase (short-subunit alcohol dehydrogenase family)
MSRRFVGRTILVTGGASGIGFATARRLALEGAAVAIFDRDATRLEQAAAALRGLAPKGFSGTADVQDFAALSRALAEVEAALGPIDGLVNNAGVAGLGSVHELDEAEWARIIGINVTGVFLAAKAVLPGMMQRKRGVIVNVASIAGLVGIPAMAAYCASKGAVTNLTRQMAVDYAKWGIRVNAVAPGTVDDTAMGAMLLASDQDEEARARRLSKYPLGRFGRAEEIAEVLLFLLSDEASFVTGTIMTADGGMTAI